MKLRFVFVTATVVAAVAIGGYFYWQQQIAAALPEGIVSSNGRIEADQIHVATRYAGRVLEVAVDEGEMVDAGAVIARMDAAELAAQLRRAEAEVRRTERAKAEADASVVRALSQFEFAEAELRRAQRLHRKGYATTERLDQRQNELRASDAAYRAAVAGVEQANEAIVASREEQNRLQAVLNDMILKAPKRGRVQYRLAEPGEVLAAGGRIVTLLDLSDLHMTVFLSASNAARLVVGGEARIVLDAIPQYVIPARVSFVSSDAQFTPRAVETAEEREKLVFRVKLRINPQLLEQYEDRAKAGVRGVAFVRLPDAGEWPEHLQVKLPE